MINLTTATTTHINPHSLLGMPNAVLAEILKSFNLQELIALKPICKTLYGRVTDDKEFIKDLMVVGNWKVILVASPTLKQDTDLLELVFPEHKRNDKDVVLQEVQKDGLKLFAASDKLQNDRDVVLAAISQNPKAIKYASKTLQNDEKMILAVLKFDSEVSIAAAEKNWPGGSSLYYSPPDDSSWYY